MELGRGEKAKELFQEGYNCSQAVLGAFCDECGMDFETAMKLSSSFGGGMGRLREVCGAVSGMFMVAGLIYGYDDPKGQKDKTEHYERIQALAQEFKEKNGSIVCRELLGLSEKKSVPTPEVRTEQYYQKRPCPEMVKMAAEIMEKYIQSNPK
ncbi:MAG: C_GCAxxG_C_C family protein [Lachnospiraceae bacterium]|nr:C_GCAxxG_C_C family protein [Lachnospiraceae bacterium]